MKKRKTLKWLVIFIAVLLASMFFARTVQTITTPKIQKISATRGRLEEKIPLPSTLVFTEGLEVSLPEARKLNIVFSEVLAAQGYFVKKGDLLVRANIPTLDEEIAKLQAEYDKAVRTLGEHIASNARLAQDSPHNQLQEAYYDSLLAYYDKKLAMEQKALKLGYELPEDIEAWGRRPEPETTPSAYARATPTPVPLADMPQELKAGMQEVLDVYIIHEETFRDLRRVYVGTGSVAREKVGSFDHIKKIYELKRAIAVPQNALLELLTLADGLKELRAPHDGYLVKFEVKRGDSYDGSKVIYTISQEGEVPKLKVDITDVKKTIEKGAKASIEGLRQELTIQEIELATASRKLAVIELNADLIGQLGGVNKLLGAAPQVTILYRSPRTTTILPASAVRSDSDGSSFVYTVQSNWGGMLGNMQYIVKKQKVTVLERSERMVAISDEMGFYEIADKEDRSISDNQVVMEYVD